jgi:hypothetical protein
MKKISFVLSVALMGLLFASCSDIVREKVEYMVNEPVFMSLNEFRSADIVSRPPQEIESQGKICFYEGYLYISESGEGIHVIDNRNPSSPKAISFIELDGNADITVCNDKLYADTFVDLIWFDVSNPAEPKHAGRLENAFKYAMPYVENEGGFDYEMCYAAENKDKVVVGWNLVKRSYYYEYNRNDRYNEAVASPGGLSSGGKDMSSSGGKGVNGSMSRFNLYKDYLYTVMNSMMTIIDLSGAEPVKAVEDLQVDWQVETIFNYKDYMFLGTPTGMSIYSVANPVAPERMSTVWHLTGCDPVVVENDIAYITIHSGNFCGANNDQLIIYDVSDVKSPRHLVSYGMTKPKGLGIDNGTLFVCDDGLKVFDAKEPQKLMNNQLVHYSGMEGYDLIPYNKILMMIADDGLYQYDYSDVNKISQLSKIAVKNRK